MFLSIRWKIILLAGLVMAGMAGLFSIQQQYALTHQFKADQALYQERLRVMAGRLFNTQNDRLQVLARMLAETPSIRAAMKAGDSQSLREAVEPLWPELSMGQGLAALVFFDPQQRALGQWGDAAVPGLAALAKQANRSESPQTWLACGDACMHQLVLPTAERGKPLGGVALVTGMESLVLDLRRLGEGEVAVLAATPGAVARSLSGMRVLSVSGGETTRLILQSAQAKPQSGAYVPVSLGENSWHVMIFPPDLPGDGLLHLGVIANVTQAVRAIQVATLRNLAWGGGVLLAALLVLFFLLRPLTARIKKVSSLLPLLGQKRFDEVLNALSPHGEHAIMDEMHGLERLAGELAHQLQALDAADKAHTQALADQAVQLEQERDLVAGLLDTAPVLIVTYGRDLRIRMANAFAAVDSGFSREQLVGKQFTKVFMNSSQAAEHQRQVHNMTLNDVIRGEGSFVQAGGGDLPRQFRDVVWFHSCLDDIHGERLFLSVGLDVTEHRLTEQRLELLASHDGVTGLLNRHTFKRRLESLLGRGGKGVMLVCDIDEFRSLNDLDGHEAGDRILMIFARLIQNLRPAPNLSARLGSDEFALVFPDMSTADALLIARQLNRVAAQHVSDQEDMVKRSLSASVGLVLYPDHGNSPDALLGNAELALAYARAKGHGSWHLFSEKEETYREMADRRAYWREEVEAALEENRFVLHYQPIARIADGELSHYEALLRMIGRDGRLVPPGLFIDVAESTGVIRRIDHWVVEAAVAAAALRPEFKIALNLSSRSFDDDVSFETMQAALARYHVAGERLLIEITETAALANFSGAKRIMGKFKELGCAFGLDDFGVGYSSFQYLKELPVDFVKIDGSFVKNLTRNPDDVVFVRALHSAVKGFGKTTVAEFVEDEETLAILREIGVDHVQGYLLGKPGPDMDWKGQ